MTINDLPSIIYHGTISIHKDSLLAGIDISKGYHSADFGQGFYTTGNYEQAKNIAVGRANGYFMRKHIKVVPMVLSYSLNLEVLAEYKGKIFDDNMISDWKEFVYNNRVGSKASVSNFHNLTQKYHYVYGYVADSHIIDMTREARKGVITFGEFSDNLKTLKNGEYSQLSFHSSEAVRALGIRDIELIEREELLV